MMISTPPSSIRSLRWHHLAAAVLLVCLFASCRRDESTHFTALTQRYDGGKAYVDGDVVYWTSGDNVRINGGVYAVTVDGSNHNSATIDAEGVAAIGGVYYAVYPAASSSLSGTTATFALPQTEPYTLAGGCQQLDNLMAAAASGTTLEFQNLCALLHFSLASTAAGAKLCAIEVSCDQPLWGELQATYSSSTWSVTPPSDAANTMRRLSFASPQALSTTAQDFYLQVPPVSGISSFTLRYIFEDGNGTVKSYDLAKAGTISFAQGVMYNFPTDTYNGTQVSNSAVSVSTNSMDGSASHPYELYSTQGWKAMLKAAATNTGKHFTLQTDITVDTTFNDFKASLDGNGHTVTLGDPNKALFKQVTAGTIENLQIDADTTATAPECYDIGSTTNLFGFLACTTYNCTISHCINRASVNYTTSNAHLGGLCGRSRSVIIDCRNEGNICGKGPFIGGIVGYIEYSNAFSGNSNSGNITMTGSSTTTSYCGGLAGHLNLTGDDLYVSDCTNSGSITVSVTSNGIEGCIGGLFGRCYDNIIDCSNSGSITNNATLSNNLYFGGLIGRDSQSNTGTALHTIRNCYNEGNIAALNKSHMFTGGLVGSLTYADIINCYTYCSLDGAYVAGLVGSTITGIDNECTLSNCYFYGSINASDTSFGLSGVTDLSKHSHQIDHCYCPTGMTMYHSSCTGNDNNAFLSSALTLSNDSSLSTALNSGATTPPDKGWTDGATHVVFAP